MTDQRWPPKGSGITDDEQIARKWMLLIPLALLVGSIILAGLG